MSLEQIAIYCTMGAVSFAIWHFTHSWMLAGIALSIVPIVSLVLWAWFRAPLLPNLVSIMVLVVIVTFPFVAPLYGTYKKPQDKEAK